MERLQLPSYAKVNLTLDVLEKRPEDGYHYVRTVMLPISLSDQVCMEWSEHLSLTCSPPIPGAPEENLAFRAAALLRQVTGYRGGAAIHIDKVIPVAGGLAGGSTNAAAVLTGLNRLWGTGLSTEQLVQLAIRLGSDVPFFVPSRPALVEGIGERLTPVRVARPFWMVIATPAVPKSTGHVFKLFDELQEVERPRTEAMLAALATGDLQEIAGSLGNVFEQVMLPRHPEIGELKRRMLEGGALGALMSGAGPTVFGIVRDPEAGEALLEQIRGHAEAAHLVRTVL
ncbi:MAG: 4-(cytidine 5'-diphospho)-2-C-methyl-D-erythritol kinase [Bacillota bacterium]